MRLLNSRRPVPARISRLYYRKVYLNSEWWIKFREGWWSRHPNAKCVVCERKKGNNNGNVYLWLNGVAYRRSVPIDLHHKTYERLWCERDDDVEPICRDCHRKHRH